MTTIVLLVSRDEFLTKVITCLELLECDKEQTNILCIVDGDNALYIKTRNLVQGMKFNQRLTVRSDFPGSKLNTDIPTRRRRIAFAHNQARDLIQHTDGYVFSVEDDTLFGPTALEKLLRVANTNRAFAFAEGVELGRWGVPYVGAWLADDIYDTKELTSVENIYPVSEDQVPTRIDAGGLYCALIRADLYKQHEFNSDNNLGPDINFGLELRQLGYDNFIVWTVPCKHLFKRGRKELEITPREKSRVVKITKQSNGKFQVNT